MMSLTSDYSRVKLKIIRLKKRYLHKSGRTLDCLLTASLIRDSQGEPLYIVAQIEDITERKLAEEKLRQANENLENKIDERTSDLLAMNGELEALNEELQRLTLADGLTGIANRRYFDEYLEREWANSLAAAKTFVADHGGYRFFSKYSMIPMDTRAEMNA